VRINAVALKGAIEESQGGVFIQPVGMPTSLGDDW
jgi:hypothetical protein